MRTVHSFFSAPGLGLGSAEVATLKRMLDALESACSLALETTLEAALATALDSAQGSAPYVILASGCDTNPQFVLGFLPRLASHGGGPLPLTSALDSSL